MRFVRYRATQLAVWPNELPQLIPTKKKKKKNEKNQKRKKRRQRKRKEKEELEILQQLVSTPPPHASPSYLNPE